EPYSEGNQNRVRFLDTSEADQEAGARIISYKWDFDLDYDSSGDGVDDNDNDANVRDPDAQYTRPGTYQIKLEVTDNFGNTAEISRQIRIPLGSQSTADFSYQNVG